MSTVSVDPFICTRVYELPRAQQLLFADETVYARCVGVWVPTPNQPQAPPGSESRKTTAHTDRRAFHACKRPFCKGSRSLVHSVLRLQLGWSKSDTYLSSGGIHIDMCTKLERWDGQSTNCVYVELSSFGILGGWTRSCTTEIQLVFARCCPMLSQNTKRVLMLAPIPLGTLTQPNPMRSWRYPAAASVMWKPAIWEHHDLLSPSQQVRTQEPTPMAVVEATSLTSLLL